MAGTLVIDTLKASSGVLATQNGMSGVVKGWCFYNGGTSAIYNSFNVSSVTKVTTGQWTINFATAMPTTNYGYTVGGPIDNGSSSFFFGRYGSATTTSFGMGCMRNTVGFFDQDWCIAFYYQ